MSEKESKRLKEIEEELKKLKKKTNKQEWMSLFLLWSKN